MNKSPSTIGNKIKEIRLKKNLTQDELCGTEITRNNLSLIERGKSLPSLKTLCYLADRLDVPCGYFFSDSEAEEVKFINFFASDDLKFAYKSHNYKKCIEIADSVPSSLQNDETAMLSALSHFYEGIISAEALDSEGAKKHMRCAVSSALHTSYLGDDFFYAASYYELLFSSLLQTDIPMRLYDFHESSSYVPIELIMYFKMLSEKKSAEHLGGYLTNPYHIQHFNAREASAKNNYQSEYKLLLSLAEDKALPYYMRYNVWNDLEICSNIIGEFKTAYLAATFKLKAGRNEF